MTLLQKLSLLSFAACAPLCAQNYTAKHIVFKHAGEYTQAQLEAASGFHAGMAFTGEDVAAGAQRLADSGFFDNVTAALDGTNAAMNVTFDLTPGVAGEFVPVGFENFVWLTPDELKAAVRTKVPLFNGVLPEAGPQGDAAAEGLVAALTAKGIEAKVKHTNVEPTLIHPLRAMEFRVSSPAVTVANVKLDGVSTALVPLLQVSVNKTARSLYNDGLVGLLTRDRLLEPIMDAGYAKASLTGVAAEMGPPSAGTMPVVVKATLDAGEVYRVGAITFAGMPLYSADEFAKSTALKTGDLASRKALLDTLGPVDAAYRNKGYLDVIVKAEPTFDEAAKTVSYTVTVEPGEPYKLHEMTTQGLGAGAKADFDRGFAIKPGDVYSPGYVAGFIKENTALTKLSGYTGVYQATAYPATHTVDLVLVFANTSVDAR